MFKNLLKKINPCDANEDSLTWKIMCTIFPPCFCCAGIRGFVYGVLTMQFIMWWI